MKNGYKHNTSSFGSDAELYVSRVLMMIRHKKHDRRPDLISPPGQYTPRLTTEVKSGIAKKGVIVQYQLPYGIRGADDYNEEFGETLPVVIDPSLLPGLPQPELLPATASAVYYYNVTDREKIVRSGDLDKPFSAIHLEWKDQFFVPGEFGFYAFAVARHMRTGEVMPDILEDLRDKMKQDILDQCSNHKDRKGKQSWQDLHARDILAVFHNDPSYATRHGKKRVALLSAQYADLPNLKPIKIPGPNETTLWVLAKPEHEALFNRQVRGIVRQRIPIIERITRSRKQSRNLLKKVKASAYGLYANGGVEADDPAVAALTDREFSRLERLVHWLDAGETALTYGKDDIPF